LFLFTTIAQLQAYLAHQRRCGKSVGFVPTMGALHKGHIELIEKAKAQTDIVVCSIFVNPTQFNNKQDLVNYPQMLDSDIHKLSAAGCSVLFCPSAFEMYPEQTAKVHHYNWGAVTNSFEGAFRPAHFDGVITVVKRLFDIVQPKSAFFGRKDLQQCAVVNSIVERWNMPISIMLVETIRESDGLAMSSRNMRLSEAERKEASLLYQTLLFIKNNVSNAPQQILLEEGKAKLEYSELLRVEYLAIVNQQTFEEVLVADNNAKYAIIIAVWCGNVRLIDNITL
jgi:pantoate--beta-alanine ligase